MGAAANPNLIPVLGAEGTLVGIWTRLPGLIVGEGAFAELGGHASDVLAVLTHPGRQLRRVRHSAMNMVKGNPLPSGLFLMIDDELAPSEAASRGLTEYGLGYLKSGGDVVFMWPSKVHGEKWRAPAGKGGGEVPKGMAPDPGPGSRRKVGLLGKLFGWGLPDAALVLEAVKEGDYPRLVELLAAGTRLDAVDSRGLTPLMCASAQNDPECVRILLEAGADPNVSRADGNTALILAAINDSGSVIAELARSGCPLDALLAKGRSAVAYAAMHGRIEAIRALAKAGASVSRQGEDGVTPLMDAAANGQAEAAKELLQLGADHRGVALDRTALMMAIDFGQVDAIKVVKVLLDAGADVNWRNGSGLTALALAMEKADPGLAECLIEAGADPNTRIEGKKGWEGFPALALAAAKGWVTVSERLLVKGARVDDSDSTDHRTALFYAAGLENEELVRLLLRHRANPNARDAGGATPLVVALGLGAKGQRVVEILMAAGAK